MLMLCLLTVKVGYTADAVVGVVRSDNAMLREPVAPDRPLSVEQVEDMVRAAVKLAGGLEPVLRSDAKVVVIKPNIVEMKPAGDATVTDWRVVFAVARMAHEIAPGAEVKVVECCNWDIPGADCKQDGWGYAGYRNLEGEPYIELVNMHYDSVMTRSVPGGGSGQDEYFVPETMAAVDCFIDVPVVKIIGVVRMTAAMKNLVGVVPMTASPHRVRLIPHTLDTLAEAIVDLNLLHRVDFVVSDLIQGMEVAKTTEWEGRPVRMNTILAGPDVVAVDAISAELIGLNPDDIEYLTLGQMRGLGVADLSRIEVRGEEASRISRRFEKSPGATDRYGQTPKVWTIKGPFPTEDPMEEFLDPVGLSVVPGEDGWSEPIYFYNDRIDLRRALGKPTNCIAYAYTDFLAPRDEPSELWVGSSEYMTVWIDGKKVYEFAGARRHEIPLDKQPIRLTKGRHGLLVKVHQTFGDFDFSLNICEAEEDPRYEGNRVRGLKFLMMERVRLGQR